MKNIKKIWWLFNRFCFSFNYLLLSMKGVRVSLSTTIHWTATIEPSGGSVEIGANTYIDRGVILRAYGGSIAIGTDCTINAYSVLYGDGGLCIGNGVRIATHTIIVSANHIFDDKNKFIFRQGQSRQGIIIEDDVWIGSGVTVLDGTIIRRGCVIGAGSVVTRPTESYGIYIGSPAKKTSSRK